MKEETRGFRLGCVVNGGAIIFHLHSDILSNFLHLSQMKAMLRENIREEKEG